MVRALTSCPHPMFLPVSAIGYHVRSRHVAGMQAPMVTAGRYHLAIHAPHGQQLGTAEAGRGARRSEARRAWVTRARRARRQVLSASGAKARGRARHGGRAERARAGEGSGRRARAAARQYGCWSRAQPQCACSTMFWSEQNWPARRACTRARDGRSGAAARRLRRKGRDVLGRPWRAGASWRRTRARRGRGSRAPRHTLWRCAVLGRSSCQRRPGRGPARQPGHCNWE